MSAGPLIFPPIEVAASVVVVNYNGYRHLPRLMAALGAQTWRDYELIFVDNGSDDGSVPFVQGACRRLGIRLALQLNSRNLGFSPGCNQGMRLAHGAWIATLNNDTQPEPEWLEKLLAAADSPSQPGMIASKMLFAHPAGQINSAGVAVDFAGIAWDWRGGDPDRPDERGLQEVFGPCAGAAMYARRMLAEVGIFDDDFFAYLEDVDLAWRARLAGWHCLFQPEARVYHVHSATLGESARKRYLLGRNKIWVLVKNYPAAWLPVGLPLILAYDLMALSYGAFGPFLLASLQGRLAGWRGLPTFLRKRRLVHSHPLDVANCRRVISPLATPLGVARRYAHLQDQAARPAAV